MGKNFKKTLILIIITAIFLAPFSGGVKINDRGHLAVGVETLKDLLTCKQDVCYTLYVNLTAFSAQAGTAVSF